jgi:hypothetical protein
MPQAPTAYAKWTVIALDVLRACRHSYDVGALKYPTDRPELRAAVMVTRQSIDAEAAERAAFQRQIEASRAGADHFGFTVSDDSEVRSGSSEPGGSFARYLKCECDNTCACVLYVFLCFLVVTCVIIPLLSLATFPIVYPALLLNVLSASSLPSGMAYYETQTKGTAVGAWTALLALYCGSLALIVIARCSTVLCHSEVGSVWLIIAAIIAVLIGAVTICISFTNLNVVSCFKTEEAFVAGLAPNCVNATIALDDCDKLRDKYSPFLTYFQVNRIIALVVGVILTCTTGFRGIQGS